MKIGLMHLSTHDIKGIILENLVDFNEYVDFASKEIEIGVKSVIKHPEPIDRWDHICRDISMFSAMFSLSLQKASFEGGNPLMNLDGIINEKYKSILECILEGSAVVINNVGGWCPSTKLGYTILEDGEYEPPLHYYIAKPRCKDGILLDNLRTQYITIENDPDIPEFTRNNLKHIDPYYSSTRNSFYWREQDYIKVLTEFKENGGVGLYLYTTGRNLNQMKTYMKVAIDIGLSKFIFNFNCEKNDLLIDFINEYIDNTSIEIDYKFV